MTHPWRRSSNPDRKLALLRRVDTERDSRGFSLTGERKRASFIKPLPITLPHLKCLERPLEADDD